MKNIVKSYLLVVLFSTFIFAQDNVYQLGFLYMGSDTLDAEDGGCTKTEVVFDKLVGLPSTDSIIITGQVRDLHTSEPFNNSWGRIFLGSIDTVLANTWLGYGKTGKLVRKKEFKLSDNGEYRIIIPKDEKDFLIFTGIGCNVKYYSVNEIINYLEQ
ncbi:MAG: hypothetical protein K9J16_15505 [Melioribacteraceae bacterium]|nr:hypothetical protein [Melioribacteraceae bacterium]MCF8355956.1 hypothetical protein [Melioribacteraceae bacterium]MCF8420791.1 hypothetical protein [Melioribacteraceae bacterium]